MEKRRLRIDYITQCSVIANESLSEAISNSKCEIASSRRAGIRNDNKVILLINKYLLFSENKKKGAVCKGLCPVLLSFALLVLFFCGCSKSVIDITTKIDDTTYSMFGKVASRDFYSPVTISDSLVRKWKNEINGSFPSSSVVVHDHFAFLNDLSGRIYCFDIQTGKRVGQLKYKGSVFTTPVLEQLKVIFAYSEYDDNYSTLIVYDFAEGKLLAEKDEIKGRALSEMIKVADGVMFTTEDGRIYKYSFNGLLDFEFNTKSFSHSSPALNNNILVFGNDKGELIGFDVKNQYIVYREKMSEVPLSGVSISGETVFAGNYSGTVYASNLLTGKVLWKYETNKRIDMTPAFDNDNVYIGNLGGELFALNKADGKLAWKSVTKGVLNATPLITDNIIIAPDLNKEIHFINKQNGVIQKTMELEGRARLSPVYFDNLLFIGYDNGILEAYEFVK